MDLGWEAEATEDGGEVPDLDGEVEDRQLGKADDAAARGCDTWTGRADDEDGAAEEDRRRLDAEEVRRRVASTGRRRRSRVATGKREVGSAGPRENAGFGSGSPCGWASKCGGNLGRERFPRGLPAREKGREGGLPN